jgi:hypothetical protein
MGRYFTGQADYTDYKEGALEMAKSVGFNCPRLGAGQFILYDFTSNALGLTQK